MTPTTPLLKVQQSAKKFIVTVFWDAKEALPADFMVYVQRVKAQKHDTAYRLTESHYNVCVRMSSSCMTEPFHTRSKDWHISL